MEILVGEGRVRRCYFVVGGGVFVFRLVVVCKDLVIFIIIYCFYFLGGEIEVNNLFKVYVG